jgi:hypothetical protein
LTKKGPQPKKGRFWEPMLYWGEKGETRQADPTFGAPNIYINRRFGGLLPILQSDILERTAKNRKIRVFRDFHDFTCFINDSKGIEKTLFLAKNLSKGAF